MRARLTLIAAGFAIALTVYYAASPLIAGYRLREAVRLADVATVERMIDWPSLRASVKATVAQNAKLLPIATEAARRVRATWWQRIRSLFGHSMLDRFIERYITPQGLPKLYRAKNNWYRRTVHSQPAIAQAGMAGIIPDQLARAWRRLKSAKFTSLFRFVAEIEDRHKPNRLITTTFHLSNIGFSGIKWKLVAISIRELDPSKAHLAKLNGFK